ASGHTDPHGRGMSTCDTLADRSGMSPSQGRIGAGGGASMARSGRGAQRPDPSRSDPPRPTPQVMGGSIDPARRVRPVDWSAGGRRPAAEPAAGSGDAARQGGGDAAGSPSARLPRRRARTVELPRPVPAPPTDAVHSLSAEDPRPLPRPLRIADEEIRSVGVGALRTEQIVQTVADPQDAWTADAGTSDHFLRGEVVVQVRRADNAVIGLFSTRYALSVRPAEYEPALDIADEAAGPSARGGQGTRHPTSRRELLRRMEAAGFVVTPRGDARSRLAPRPPGARAALRLDALGPALHPPRGRADPEGVRDRPAALTRIGRRRAGRRRTGKCPGPSPRAGAIPFPRVPDVWSPLPPQSAGPPVTRWDHYRTSPGKTAVARL